MYRNIPETIDEVTRKLQLKLENIEDETYNPGSIPLTKLKNWVRESYQDLHREKIKSIIAKLKQRKELTQEEMELMELWMVGDLENFAILEKHYNEWIICLQEHIQKLNSLNEPEIHQNSDKLLKIQGLIMEMEHVLHQLDQYQYTMDRIRRFKSYVGINALELTDTQRFELAQILQEMINSPLH